MEKAIAKSITRIEKYLASIVRDDNPPHPVTNNERLLYNIAVTIRSLIVAMPLVVNFVLVSNDGEKRVDCDTTYQEIRKAVEAHRPIIGFCDDHGLITSCDLESYELDNDGGSFVFCGSFHDLIANEEDIMCITVHENEAIDFVANFYALSRKV